MEVLREAGHRVTTAPTTGPNTAGGLAKCALKQGADLILAAGGDGTINEVANGMIGSETPLGILPAGTANVLATEICLGGMQRAARSLSGLVPAGVSAGALYCGDSRQPRYFLMMAGIGLDALIVYHLNPRLKAVAGKLAYWTAGLSHVGQRLPQFEVRADGRSVRCGFALAARVRNYGGDFQIAPSVSLLDNDFELVLFEGERASGYLRYLGGMIAGKLASTPGVSVIRAKQVEFGPSEDARVYLQIDGEYAGRLPARIEIVERAVTLLVPPAFAQPR